VGSRRGAHSLDSTMQLLRDEYGLMADMFKVQIANEKGAAPVGFDRN
jgi:hypothetical protein